LKSFDVRRFTGIVLIHKYIYQRCRDYCDREAAEEKRALGEYPAVQHSVQESKKKFA
jgi:hypothetical protein